MTAATYQNLNKHRYLLLSWKTLRKPSIPWSSSVSVFVIERMGIIHSLKCTVPFSFVVPLVSLAITYYHLLSLAVTHCIIRCHFVTRSTTPWHLLLLVIICCHLFLFVVTRCTTRCSTRCHSLSFVVTHCTTRCHSLSFFVSRCHSMYHSSLCLSFYKWLLAKMHLNSFSEKQILTFECFA